MTEVRKYGRQLSMLLQEHVDDVEEDCLEQALLIAISANNSVAVEKLIMKGVDNILDALNLSMVQERHQIRGLLLLVIAAVDGNRELTLKLFGEDVHIPEEFEVSCTFFCYKQLEYTLLHLINYCKSQLHQLIAKTRLSNISVLTRSSY